MYFELDNKFIKKDSTISLTLGYRYVDPNFGRVLAHKQDVWIMPQLIVTQFIRFIPTCL